MSRKSKAPRLWLYKRPGRASVWVILDRSRQISTGCGESDLRGAEEALARYIAEKHKPVKKAGAIDEIFVADVVNVYLKEHAPKTDSLDFLVHTATPIIEWWGDKTLADVRKTTCAEYLEWRVKQGVKESTARHDLKTLRAAINYYHAEHGPLPAVPVVSIPDAPPPREDYWLTRKEVADRIRVALRNKRLRHIARMLLIGVYTGTRPGAILDLRWVPSTEGGWFDLESETLYRKGLGRTESKKRQPKARIHARLLPHLKRWRRMDMEQGVARRVRVGGKLVKVVQPCTHVIHYFGKPIQKLRNSWPTVAIKAGQAVKDETGKWVVMDGPHICRHTAATWQMQSGTDPYEAAGYLGMSVETLLEVYGHHHPDFQNKAATASGKRRQRNANEMPMKQVNTSRTKQHQSSANRR